MSLSFHGFNSHIYGIIYTISHIFLVLIEFNLITLVVIQSNSPLQVLPVCTRTQANHVKRFEQRDRGEHPSSLSPVPVPVAPL